jgi:carboxylate-amine ligase
MAHDFKFGIEEELFLASARTRAAPRRSLAAFHKAAQKGMTMKGSGSA